VAHFYSTHHKGQIMTPSTVIVDLEVTQENIDNGIRYSIDRCPIGLAVRKILNLPEYGQPGLEIIDNFISVVSFSGMFTSKILAVADVPKEVESFIDDFDSEKPVFPFKFQLTFTIYCPDELKDIFPSL